MSPAVSTPPSRGTPARRCGRWPSVGACFASLNAWNRLPVWGPPSDGESYPPEGIEASPVPTTRGERPSTSPPGGVGVPIATEKKQRTRLEAPVPPRFPFSKPVSSRLIPKIAFENDYRESRTRGIMRSDPKILELLDYHSSREGLPGEIVVFSPLLSEARVAPDWPDDEVGSTHRDDALSGGGPGLLNRGRKSAQSREIGCRGRLSVSPCMVGDCDCHSIIPGHHPLSRDAKSACGHR